MHVWPITQHVQLFPKAAIGQYALWSLRSARVVLRIHAKLRIYKLFNIRNSRYTKETKIIKESGSIQFSSFSYELKVYTRIDERLIGLHRLSRMFIIVFHISPKETINIYLFIIKLTRSSKTNTCQSNHYTTRLKWKGGSTIRASKEGR